MFVHTVYFWLKPGTNDAEAKSLVQDCRDILGKVPSVRKIYSGLPAGAPRDVVDNSFGVGLTVLFDDAAGCGVYANHPLHLDFIEKHKAHWARVQVYDFAE